SGKTDSEISTETNELNSKEQLLAQESSTQNYPKGKKIRKTPYDLLLFGVLETHKKCFKCKHKIESIDESILICLKYPLLKKIPKFTDLRIQHQSCPNKKEAPEVSPDFDFVNDSECKEKLENHLRGRTKHCCILCGKKFTEKCIREECNGCTCNIEHIIPFSKNDKYDNLNNLALTHKCCNSEKADLSIYQHLEKVLKKNKNLGEAVIDILNVYKKNRSIRRTTKNRIRSAIKAAKRRKSKINKEMKKKRRGFWAINRIQRKVKFDVVAELKAVLNSSTRLSQLDLKTTL
ncbi:hypothetical protein HDU92_005106, partial [Lobulomyces angularis]